VRLRADAFDGSEKSGAVIFLARASQWIGLTAGSLTQSVMLRSADLSVRFSPRS